MRGIPSRAPITGDAVLRWPAILAQNLYTRGEIERFLAKVDIRGDDECWPWISATVGARPYCPDGYGVLARERAVGKPPRVYAHRMSFELAAGIELGKLLACHSCDYTICCNPGHIFCGSIGDNVADMDAKGRRRWLAGPPSAPRKEGKLAEIVVRQGTKRARNADIRARYAAGGVFLWQLGEEYGMSESGVCRIVKGNRGNAPVGLVSAVLAEIG